MRFHLAFGVVVFSLLLTSCKDKTEDDEQLESFANLLIRTEADIIAPVLTDFETACLEMHDASSLFEVDPSLSNLSNLKQKFIAAYKSWQHVSQFRFGPATEFDIHGKCNTFPSDYIQIEYAISNGTTSGLTNAVVGFPAIDYLLFHFSDDELLQQFANQTRMDYLVARTYEISTLATQYKGSWSTGYRSTFIAADGPSVTGGLSLLVNGWIVDYEQIKREKVALPLGLLTLGIPLPEKVEAYHSGESLTLIHEQLNAVQEVFNNSNGYGLSDLLDDREAWHNPTNMLLSEQINIQLDEARVALTAIEGPLSEAIETQPAVVENAYTELQQVVVLLKTDMISALGISITSNDNDGD